MPGGIKLGKSESHAVLNPGAEEFLDSLQQPKQIQGGAFSGFLPPSDPADPLGLITPTEQSQEPLAAPEFSSPTSGPAPSYESIAQTYGTPAFTPTTPADQYDKIAQKYGTPGQAPKPKVGGGGIAAPPGTFGGQYFPGGVEAFEEDILRQMSEVETDRLQGKITDAQAKAKYRTLEAQSKVGQRFAQSPAGIQDSILRSQIEGQQDELSFERDLLNIEQRQQAHRQAVLANVMSQEANAEKARQERYRAFQSGHAQVMEEYKAAQADVARSSIVADRRGAAEKVVGSIGVALGAFGAALARTPNFAWDILQQRLESDLQAQKANLAKKQTVAEGKREQMTIYNQHFKDSEMAEQAARADIYRLAQRRLEAMAGKAGDEATGLKYQFMADQANRIASENEKNLMLQGALRHLQMQQQGRPVVQRKAMVMDKEARDRYVPGFGLAGTKEDADRIKAMDRLTKNFGQQIGEIDKLSKTDLQDRAYADALSANLTLMIKSGKLGEALDKQTSEIVERVKGGDVNALTDPTVRNTLKYVDRVFKQELRNDVDSSVLEPGQHVVAPDEKGAEQLQFQRGTPQPSAQEIQEGEVE